MKRVSYKIDTPECDAALYIDNLHKNIFYHWFFGWRRTIEIDGIAIMDFIFSEKDLKLIEKISKNTWQSQNFMV